MKGNCLIAQSGGPTAVINNSLCGILKQAMHTQKAGKIFGAKRGIYGMLHGEYANLTHLPSTVLDRLRCSPGAALGSWRCKLSQADVVRMVEHMRSAEIRFFFYIGGNGSMQVARMIEQTAKEMGYGLTVIGIPKTVDNDLCLTDHAPGFGSAAKFIATCVLDIAMDIRSLPGSKRVTIVETMGRNAGWLAAASALSGEGDTDMPPLIYIPEAPFRTDRFLEDIQSQYDRYGCALAVVSEGIRDEAGRLLAEDSIAKDPVGRPQLGGVSAYLARLVSGNTGLQGRNVLPGIWQRSGMLFSSRVDVDEAYQAGKAGFQLALEGRSGVMVSLRRIGKNPYTVAYEHVPLSEVAGRERTFPVEWYDSRSRSVSQAFREYVAPLIQGEVLVPMNNGLPVYQTI
ncbi:diphosphate--fructose-6-phosphate 1-phosphotransferase [Brevibacillus borstelensis]|uniref:6-phosphofructokinase n=1 Tax=Brevibacillus borstelensis TaxID=45462 RepID=UPI0030BF75DF